LTIEQAVAEGIQNNLGLVAERYSVPIADARLLTASLRPNPVASVWGNYLDILGTGFNAATNAAGPTESGARVDVVFERGGKRQQRIEVARAARSVAELQLLNAIRSVVLDVQTAFVEVLQAKSDLALAQETLRAFDEIVSVNTVRVRNGDLAEVELIRTQVAQLQFENSVRRAALRLQTTRAQLRLLLGRGTGGRPVDAVGEMRRDESRLTFNALREGALSRRPDLLAQRQDQARSQAELRLQLAQGKIDYTVGASVNRQWVRGLTAGNSVGVFLSVPLPLYNRNQGEIERARLEELQAESRIRATEATVESELEIAFLRYENALNALNRIEGALLGRAQEVRQITEFSYRRGEATFLEFLDAQRAYNEAVQAQTEARAEFARSLYALDAATGTATVGGLRP
jgi:cobalt-zinc-cadmium efflux system outer membrane protein